MAEEGQDKGKGKAPATDTVGDETTKQEEEAKEEKELTEANTPKPLELIPRPRNNPYGTRGEKLTLVANFFDVKYSAPKSHILLYDVSDICRERVLHFLYLVHVTLTEAVFALETPNAPQFCQDREILKTFAEVLRHNNCELINCVRLLKSLFIRFNFL